MAVEVKFSGHLTEVMTDIQKMALRFNIDPDKYKAMEAAFEPVMTQITGVPPEETGKRKSVRTSAKKKEEAKHVEAIAAAKEEEAQGMDPPTITEYEQTETGRIVEMANMDRPEVSDCRAVLDQLCAVKGMKICEEIIAEFGVPRVRDLQEGQRAAFVKRCVEALNG